MKATFKIVLLTGFIFSIFISGCKKEQDSDEAKFKSGMLSIINANQPTKHTITVSASVGKTIIGANTRFMFYPNAFTYSNGGIVTGNVQLEIQEFYTKAQMILGNKVTMSSDGPLDSRGEVYINATQNGQQLRLRSGYAYAQFEARAYNEPMNFFNGSVSGELGDISWNLNNTIVPSNGFYGCSYDSINPPVYIDTATSADICDTLYTFPLDSFNWVNCDRPFLNITPTPTFTSLTIAVPQEYEDNSTFVYVVFRNFNAVIRGWQSGGVYVAGNNFCPIGQQATIVALNYHSGSWYSSFTPITITANHEETITFSPTTIADYTARVKTLQ